MLYLKLNLCFPVMSTKLSVKALLILVWLHVLEILIVTVLVICNSPRQWRRIKTWPIFFVQVHTYIHISFCRSTDSVVKTVRH
jgi:hypothetical protein